MPSCSALGHSGTNSWRAGVSCAGDAASEASTGGTIGVGFCGGGETGAGTSREDCAGSGVGAATGAEVYTAGKTAENAALRLA